MTTEKTNTKQEENSSPEFMVLADGKAPVAKKFQLTDGRTVRIAEAKGRHSLKAQEQMAKLAEGKKDPDGGAYFTTLFSMLVTIDEKFLAPEDFADMKMTDFSKIQAEFNQINF